MLYISYNLKDSAEVEYLTQILKREGISCWKASDHLLAGDDMATKIEAVLNSSSMMLFCVSKAGISDWQRTELNWAINTSSVKVIPVLLPGADRDALPLILSPLIAVEINDWRNNQYLHFLLKSLGGNESAKFNLPNYSGSDDSGEAQNIRAVNIILMNKDKVLLLKRSAVQKSAVGFWQLPGGKVKSNEDANRAASRKLVEEVGVDVNPSDLIHITDSVDKWIGRDTNRYITMSLFFLKLETSTTYISKEFDSQRWVPISNAFSDPHLVFFGSTVRFLKIARRFYFLHLPLKVLSLELSAATSRKAQLPFGLCGLSSDAVQVLYCFLGLLGFIEDDGEFKTASTLTVSLLKTLSELALTESVIFEAQGDLKWLREAQRTNLQEVERFRSKIFASHKAILGLLSYRLARSLSSRNVCDVLVGAVDGEKSKRLILIRWDFFARKFQIPAKGLENVELDLGSIEVAKYVVEQRLSPALIKKFDFEVVGPIRTSHVSAGTLNDGPLMRNYVISLFKLETKKDEDYSINDILSIINQNTLDLISSKDELDDERKKSMLFYLWADVDFLKKSPDKLLEKRLQGFEEIIEKYGFDVVKTFRSPLQLLGNNKLPVISYQIANMEFLDPILKYDF